MTTNKAGPLSRVALGVLAACMHAGALAQEGQDQDLNALPLEQLLNLDVVTTSKIPQKISEAPSSVSVITADDIRRRGYRTLAEVLQGVRGVQVSYDRDYSYAGIRGLGSPGDLNTRLLILIDGVRLNDVIYDQGAIGTEFPIDLDMIERVEFVPGPGSAVYGSSAFFGVLNVITKSGAAYGGAQASVGRFPGSGHEARAATGARRAGGLEYLIAASWMDSSGHDLYFPEFDNAASNHGVAHGEDYDRYHRVFAKLSGGGLALEAYSGRRTKGIPTAAYGQQFGNARSYTLDEYTGAALSWRQAVSDSLEVYGGVNTSRYRYNGIFVYAASGPSVNVDESESRSSGAELRVLASGLSGHKLIAGAEYLLDSRREMRNADTDPFRVNLAINKPTHRAALYVQDEMRLGERLILNSGLRRDIDVEGGRTTNPRVALIYKATPQATLKALYGTAYRSANAYERYYTTTPDYGLNPDLRSEHIKTYELIAEYFPTDRFRAGASVFQYRLRDLLALTTDPRNGWLVYSNIDAARATGIELEAEWLGRDGGSVKGSASLQSARNDSDGTWLLNSPRRLFKLDIGQPLLGERLRANLEFRFTGRRRTTAENELGGFGVADLTLLGTLPGGRVDLSLGVLNVADKHYADSPSEEHFDNSVPPRRLRAITQDGRTVRALATVRF